MDYWNKISGKHFSGVLTWDTLFPYYLWQIWTDRNTNIFEHKSNLISLANTIGLATIFVALKPHRGHTHHNRNTIHIKWIAPKSWMTKLNTDGVVPHAPGVGGTGAFLGITKADGLWASTRPWLTPHWPM